MKKILLATTVLAMSAGFAAADVKVSGSARMGVVYTGSVAGTDAVAGKVTAADVTAADDFDITLTAGATTAAEIAAVKAELADAQSALEAADAAVANSVAATGSSTTALDATQKSAADDVAKLEGLLASISGSAAVAGTDAKSEFSSRVRVQFDLSGTTDGGLEFGASVRADQSGQGGTANGDSTVFVSGAFGKLTMGDVAGGASDNLVGQTSGVGFTGIGDNNEIGFLGGTATAARYDYTSGNLSVSVGVGQVSAADDAMSIAAKYGADNYSVALGYSKVKGNNQVDALASATFGAATVKVRLADRDTAADMAGSLSLDYVAGALTVTAFATQNHDFAGTDTAGLGVAYDLGGGAAVKAGVADNGTTTVADAGITMSF